MTEANGNDDIDRSTNSMTLRNAVISGVVSIVLSPLTTILTLLTTTFMLHQKADLNIVSVDTDIITLPIHIDDEYARALLKGSEFTLTILMRIGKSPYDYPCLNGIKDGIIRYDCLDSVKSAISDLLRVLDKEKASLKDASAATTIDAAMTKISETSLIPDLIDQHIYWGRDDKRKPEDILRPYAELLATVTNALENAQRQLLKMSSPVQRSGEVMISVGILNRGGTDSVVFSDGILRFSGQSIYLKSARGARQGGIVSKARSFSSIDVMIDEEKSPSGIVRDWRTIVTQRINQEFSITLKSLDGELSSSGRLPLSESYSPLPRRGRTYRTYDSETNMRMEPPVYDFE